MHTHAHTHTHTHTHDRLAKWLPQFISTISGSNAFMLHLVRSEFPFLLEALSQVVFIDRIRILNDSLTNNLHNLDLKTIQVTLPVRLINKINFINFRF